MKKVLLILSNLVRIRITLIAGEKITNIALGKPKAKRTVAKLAATVLTFGIIVNVAI